jgi:hypothetical protein
MGIWVTVSSFRKVSVERVDNRVFSPFSAPSLSHCPIQGPQALVKILAFSNFLNESKKPSLSAVNFTCSEPGLIPKIAFLHL